MTAAAAEATVFPQVRLSQDQGVTWSTWQNWQAGYYVGNAFDAQMSITSDSVNSVAVLETWKMEVDVPDRVDHFTGISISSLGSTIFFRPDGGTTAAFNGGSSSPGSTTPTVLAALTTGEFGSVTVGSITLSACVVNCYSSLGVAETATINLIAQGY